MPDRSNFSNASAGAARVVVVTGPAASGKTTLLLDQYRVQLRGGAPGCALWLAPNQRSAREIRDRLLNRELHACFQPNIATFERFAEQILSARDPAPRPLGDMARRALIRELIRRAVQGGQWRHLSAIADRPGLIDLCGEWIAELKRLEVWPEEFRRRACGQRPSGKDADLAHLYEEYQRALNSADLYDAEGRFWLARAALQAGLFGPYADVRWVVADGFSDFTRPQHEMLEALVRRGAALRVSLTLESDVRRGDLFAKPRATLEQLCERHGPQCEVQSTQRETTALPPALKHIERSIFAISRTRERATNTRGVRVIAASNPAREISAIGRRIKRLLLDGDADGNRVRAEDVVVVFRTLGDAAPLVRQEFTELGIPLALEAGRRLGVSGLLRALAAALRLDNEDWPFRALLAFISDAYFAPDWPEWRVFGAREATERAIREAQLPSGRRTLLEVVDRAANAEISETEDPEDESTHRQRRRKDRSASALGALRRIAEALDELPTRARLAEWVQAYEQLAATFGWRERRPTTAIERDIYERDQAAWKRLMASIMEVDAAHGDLGQSETALDRREMLDLVADLLVHESVPEPFDATGRVRVLSAHSVRALSVPYLFVAGLTEKAFPATQREDPLYGESELARLTSAGLPMVTRAMRTRDEMLLFYEVVTRATRRLCLSYTALDDRAQPLLPSPFLDELIRSLGGADYDREDIEDLSPLPSGPEPLDAADARLLAAVAARDGDSAPLAQLLGEAAADPLAANLCAALRAIQSRANRDAFGPWEGLLEGDGILSKIAERFSGDHRWSASELSRYLGCPYQFFLDSVLDIEPLDELALETDARGRGTLLHRAMAWIHAQGQSSSGNTSSWPLVAAEYRQLIDRFFDEAAPPRRRGRPVAEALEEVDRRHVRRWLEWYEEQVTVLVRARGEYDVPPAPAHFEVSFGSAKLSQDDLSRPEPFSLPLAGGEVLFAGRIDRIDLGRIAGRDVFEIIDYKSGKGRALKKTDAYNELQLALYVMAAEKLLERHIPWNTGYWFVKDRGFTGFATHELGDEGLRTSDVWAGLREDVLRLIETAVDGVRAGKFPVFSRDDECTGKCPFHAVCRVQQVRALEKTWPSRPE